MKTKKEIQDQINVFKKIYENSFMVEHRQMALSKIDALNWVLSDTKKEKKK